MGAWHEALNLAAVWNLPVVFLVINNQYGMGTSVERASAEPDIFKRAAAYRMTGERVDGDDLQAVIEASSRLLDDARENRRPAVLEAMTYRFRGHSVADAGLAYRTKEEIEQRKLADPIERTAALLREGGVDDERLEAAVAHAEAAVERAVEFAEADAGARRRAAGGGDVRAGLGGPVRTDDPRQPDRRARAGLRRGARRVSAADDRRPPRSPPRQRPGATRPAASRR